MKQVGIKREEFNTPHCDTCTHEFFKGEAHPKSEKFVSRSDLNHLTQPLNKYTLG